MTQSVLRIVRSRYNGLNEQLKQTRVIYRDGKKRYTYHKNLQWLEKPIRFSRPQADLVRNRDWSFRKEKTLLSLNTLEGRVVCPFQCRKDSRIFDPAYTSQRCPKCGNIDKTARDRDKHLYTCPVCHSVFNDDEAAARNIRELGIRYLNREEDPHYKKISWGSCQPAQKPPI